MDDDDLDPGDSPERNEPDQAIEEYTQSIKLNPDNFTCYLDRGDAYCKKCDWDLGIADYTTVIKLEPNNALWHIRRGEAYRGKGDWDKAIADFTQAIEIDIDDAEEFALRGHAYYAKGDWDQAIADYTQAISLKPDYDVYPGHPYFIEKIDRDTGENGPVMVFLPNFAVVYFNRGDAFFKKGDYDLAIADFTEVMRLATDHGETYHRRGLAYQAKGETASAEADFAKAKELL